MKILVFTEGTVIMHASGKNVSREERVKQSQFAGIQREKRSLSYNTKTELPSVKPGSVYDFKSHVPVGNSVAKIQAWEKQGATIYYLTSRRIKSEIEIIQKVLKKFDFSNAANLFYRHQGEDYKDVAERLMPDILVEDDCESIGGEKEMTYPHIRDDLKPKIKSIVVREFSGIDNLPDKLSELTSYGS